MNQLIITVLTLMNLLACSDKNKSQSEDDAYEIINYFLSKTDPPCLCNNYPILNHEVDEFLINEDDSLVLSKTGYFNSEEIREISRKVTNARINFIDKSRIKNRNVISIDSVKSIRENGKVWKFLSNTYQAEGFSTISFPVLSIDKSKAIFKIETYTEKGGAGAIYLLHKDKNGSMVIKQLEMWEH